MVLVSGTTEAAGCHQECHQEYASLSRAVTQQCPMPEEQEGCQRLGGSVGGCYHTALPHTTQTLSREPVEKHIPNSKTT